MTDVPGRLKGSGIRTLPADRVAGMLRRIKAEHGKTRRVRSVRYRVNGFRDPKSKGWVSRNPRNGQYYLKRDGAHRTPLRPTPEILRATDRISLEIEVTRISGGESRIYFITIPGL